MKLLSITSKIIIKDVLVHQKQRKLIINVPHISEPSEEEPCHFEVPAA